MIESLQNLRLLPPPCNDLVPLLTTIFVFTSLSLLQADGLQDSWKDTVEGYMSSTGWTLEKLFIASSFAIYMAMYWGYSLLIHVAEHVCPKQLSNFKIQKNAPIASWAEVAKMAPLVFFNQVAFGPIMLKGLYHVLTELRHIGDMLVVPTIPKFAGMMVLHVFVTEIWFYMVHRMLHTPFLYKHVHSIHHYYKAPSCLESVYVHPIEFILNSFAVMVVGPAVSGAPFLVYLTWMGLVTFLQVHDHSGYWFPFLPRVLMHDYHHQQIQCCYGIVGLMDGIFGTEKNLNDFVKDHEASCPSSKKVE